MATPDPGMQAFKFRGNVISTQNLTSRQIIIRLYDITKTFFFFQIGKAAALHLRKLLIMLSSKIKG